MNIYNQFVNTHPNLSTYLTSLQSSGLINSLSNGPYTLFIPTNTALGNTPLNNNTFLSSIVQGRYTTNDLTDGQDLTAVNGNLLHIIKRNGQVSVKDPTGNTANITTPDLSLGNDVVQVLGSPLNTNAHTTPLTPTKSSLWTGWTWLWVILGILLLLLILFLIFGHHVSHSTPNQRSILVVPERETVYVPVNSALNRENYAPLAPSYRPPGVVNI